VTIIETTTEAIGSGVKALVLITEGFNKNGPEGQLSNKTGHYLQRQTGHIAGPKLS